MNKECMTPEDEFNNIIDRIEIRAMAVDGPVTPTLQVATEEELSRLWELVNEISPKRKALARKILRVEKAPIEDVKQYLVNEGLDPEQIAAEGLVFIKTIRERIEIEKLLIETVMRCNLMLPTTEQELDWFDQGTSILKFGDFFERLMKIVDRKLYNDNQD